MKKYIFMASLLGLVSLSKINAQINSNVPVNPEIKNQNPFIDASSQSAYPSIGKGIVFPRTNLTTFKFKADLLDGLGLVFPTAFDGMLVYNTHIEPNATIDDPATGSYTLDLKEGFYYFSNPNGDASGSLAGGRWKPLGSGAANLASFYSQDGTLSGNREVNLDNHNLNFTGGKVGINTDDDPQGSFEVRYTDKWDATKPQTVSFPEVSTSQRSAWDISQLKPGMMIYNTDTGKQCIEMYRGVVNGTPQWDCLPGAGSSRSQNISVSPGGWLGNQWISGTSFSQEWAQFKIENNSLSQVSTNLSNAVSIENGTSQVDIDYCQYRYIVGGSPQSGTPESCWGSNNVDLASGQSAMLYYRLSGTPQGGALTARFSHLNDALTAEQTQQIGLGSATANDKEKYIVSLNTGTTTIQGLIDNTGNKISLKIPYTNGIGSYKGSTTTVTSAQGYNNDTNILDLVIEDGVFNTQVGTVDATVVVKGDGSYKVRQLSPGEEYIIATFNGTLGGDAFTLTLKGVGGIPDKNFNLETNGELEHQFVYLPVTVRGKYLVNGQPYEKEWLNNNLGADYANINSPHFNMTQQATSPTDYHAYGSLFQWGRDADGHELIVWNQSTGGTTDINSTTTNHPKHNKGWKADSQLTNYNDPCPSGWHTPTQQDLIDLHKAVSNTDGSNMHSNNSKMWNETELRLPASGHRYLMSSFFNGQGSNGRVWSSSIRGSNYAWVLWFSDGDSRVEGPRRAHAYAVRCLQD